MAQFSVRQMVLYVVWVGVFLYCSLFLLMHWGWDDKEEDYLELDVEAKGQEVMRRLKTEVEVEGRRSFIPRCFNNIHELESRLENTRWRLEIDCNDSGNFKQNRTVPLNLSPFSLQWDNDRVCLKQFINKHCYESNKTIPNVVHYVWFGKREFEADHFVSVLSAVRHQEPCAILFHTKTPPYGSYWTVLLSLIPDIILVIREEPEEIFGIKFGCVQHKADIARLEALEECGGIYLDVDQLLLRDVKELQNETFVMSHENRKNLANSMILSAPGAKFIGLWYSMYKTYNPVKWGWHSTFVPWTLAKQNTDLIKVVDNRFIHPDMPDIIKVYRSHFNLTTNYGIHLYSRTLRIPLHPENVTRWNTSLGEIWRLTLFGSREMIHCPER